MSYRGHSRARNAEMAASMIVPDARGGGVMLWRYDDYSRAH